MPRFIRGNPVMDTFRKNQAGDASIRAQDAQTRASDTRRLNQQVAQYKADKKNKILADYVLGKPGGKAPSPSSTPRVQPSPKIRDANAPVNVPSAVVPALPVPITSPPPVSPVAPVVTSVNTGAAPVAPANGIPRGTGTIPDYQAKAQALANAGFGIDASNMMTEGKLRQDKIDRATNEKFITLAATNPDLAVAYARQQGKQLPPEFMSALQSQWVREQLKILKNRLAPLKDNSQYNDEMQKGVVLILKDAVEKAAQWTAQQQGRTGLTQAGIQAGASGGYPPSQDYLAQVGNVHANQVSKTKPVDPNYWATLYAGFYKEIAKNSYGSLNSSEIDQKARQQVDAVRRYSQTSAQTPGAAAGSSQVPPIPQSLASMRGVLVYSPKGQVFWNKETGEVFSSSGPNAGLTIGRVINGKYVGLSQ
mgnify:CR=1 FL=1